MAHHRLLISLHCYRPHTSLERLEQSCRSRNKTQNDLIQIINTRQPPTGSCKMSNLRVSITKSPRYTEREREAINLDKAFISSNFLRETRRHCPAWSQPSPSITHVRSRTQTPARSLELDLFNLINYASHKGSPPSTGTPFQSPLRAA